ncbi:hypothetical protein MCL30_10020 [Acinetobacter pittii]|uniref:hypothetical protein n=1 Tax=Acinetobacter pittii TaxID=48296 RepID=UPI001EFEE2F4|nr:hypothetical protein [Acinetobacter pittii]MCG9482112.1 hypothetical protein [Acinetobacter pittii]
MKIGLKFYALSCFLFFISSSVEANEIQKENFCRGIYDYAEMVMTNRQNGVSIKVMFDSLDKTSASVNQKKLNKKYILDAYERPKYSTKEKQREEINEFSKDKFMSCLNTLS